jgi:hypothetical protein
VTTWADLQTRVEDDLDRADLDTQIDRELRRAVMHYERQRWWFNEKTLTTTATSSEASFSPPADLLILDGLEVVISSRPQKLTEYTWSRFVDEWRPTTTSGQPNDFAWRNDAVFLGPSPNQDYPLVWHYVRTLYPASFTDGTDNAWTNFAEDLITARALKTIGARPIGLANGTLMSWQELERQAYQALCGLNDQKMMTGKARPWSG